MAMRSMRRMGVVCLLVGSFGVSAADVEAPGDRWQVTSQMSMAGMPMAMPAQTHEVCTAKQWTQPPGSDQNGRCYSSDYVVNGDTATWTMSCDGMPGVGHGEITRQGTDSYEGSVTFDAGADGTMLMKLTGHRVGDCEHPM
jgi:Protein of unknown function (DUF3617)